MMPRSYLLIFLLATFTASVSCFDDASKKNGESIKPEKDEMREIFENEKVEPNLVVPAWLSGLIPPFSTEIPHDPVDEDDENEEKTLLPIKNDKQMAILV